MESFFRRKYDLHQSPGVTPVNSVGSAVIASTSLLNAQSFPFHNRSFPADTDSDVLPYPGPTVRKKKAASNQKFFLLTSKEAHETKLKEAEEKERRQKEKEKKATARKEKMEKRALEKRAQSKMGGSRKPLWHLLNKRLTENWPPQMTT